MPISVYIPQSLLVAVERRARTSKMSLNQLIVQVLEREVTARSEWSVDFFDRLESTTPAVSEAADEMSKAIRHKRRSKKPARL